MHQQDYTFEKQYLLTKHPLFRKRHSLIPAFLKNRKTVLLIIVIFALALSTPIYITYEYYENDPRFCTTCHLMDEPYELWRAGAMHSVVCHNCHELDFPAAMNLVYTYYVFNPQEVSTHAEVHESTCLECHASGETIYPQISDEVGHEEHYYRDGITCLECHGESLHQFTPPDNICGDCHDEQQKTAGMANLDCEDCHTYTSKGKVSLVPERIECIDCHARGETVMAIPNGSHQESSCSNCHELHNSSEPLECTSCHPKETLPGLHQFPTHNDCQSCHLPHQKSDVRSVCTTCHTNRVDHNAGIECSLCHQFGKRAA
jgi:cytochrome c5